MTVIIVMMTVDICGEMNITLTRSNAQDHHDHIETSMHGTELRVQPPNHISRRADMTETWKRAMDGIQIGRGSVMRRASMATIMTLTGILGHHSTSRV